MSLLPQRKKSPEEIAKLRESLGVPGISPEAEQAPPPAETIAPAEAAAMPETIAPARSEPAVAHPPEPVPHGPKPVHSLKRSERVLAQPVEEPVVAEKSPPPATPPRAAKTVRSLRKSERVPIVPAATAGPSSEPNPRFHRHSDKELKEIRRRDALAMMNPVANPKLAVAHPALLIPGYLSAVSGSACFYFYEFPMAATASCSGAALLIAGFVFLRRPISRHHAAFIAVIALFVLIFGTLHFFPHLRNAT